jgi:hypothetical protein
MGGVTRWLPDMRHDIIGGKEAIAKMNAFQN